MSNLLHNKSQQKVSDFSNQEIELIKNEINIFVEALKNMGAQEAKNKISDDRFGIALNSILHVAVKFSEVAAVIDILKIIEGDRLILNIRNSDSYAPLHIAAIAGNAEIVDLLLDAGCDSNPQASMAKRQWRPIHYAAKYGHLEVVKMLIAAGVDKEVKTFFHLTPMVVAAEFGQLEILQYFIKIEADLNAKTSDENSNMNALHYATIQGSAPCVEALLKAGIKKNEYTSAGLDALDFAARGDNIEILKTLIAWGVGDVNQALLAAKKSDSFNVVEILNKAISCKKDLFNKSKINALQDNIINSLKSFNENNLYEAKVILSDDIALNAYGILALTANVGFFVKSKKSLKGFCLENGLFKLSEELIRLEKMVGAGV
jgi:ankyrin repeat protein